MENTMKLAEIFGHIKKTFMRFNPMYSNKKNAPSVFKNGSNKENSANTAAGSTYQHPQLSANAIAAAAKKTLLQQLKTEKLPAAQQSFEMADKHYNELSTMSAKRERAQRLGRMPQDRIDEQFPDVSHQTLLNARSVMLEKMQDLANIKELIREFELKEIKDTKIQMSDLPAHHVGSTPTKGNSASAA